MSVSVELNDSGTHIEISADWRYRDLCVTLPGSSWDGKVGYWTIPVSWSGCLALRSTFKDDLVIGPNLTDWANHELQTRIQPAMQLRELTGIEEGDPVLFPHQRAGVEFLATARQALLADEPGLGKTVQSIRALKMLHDSGVDVFPILIVCPSSLKKNWEREFALWWPELSTQIIKGTAAERRKQFQLFTEPGLESPDVLIINWEALRSHSRLAPYGSIALKKCEAHGGEDAKITPTKCEVHPKELNAIDFKSAIADEIHRSKSPKSKQTRALWAATGDAEIRFALTGTPIGNDVSDLWPILHWINPKEWPAKTKWIDRMVETMLNAYGGLVIIGIKATMYDEFHKALQPRMRRMLKKVVLPHLPPKVFERRDTEMSPKQKKAYVQMRDKMIAELDGQYMTASSILTQTQRLIQLASSYAEVVPAPTPTDPYAVDIKMMEPSSKIDTFIDDIKNGDFGDESIAVTATNRQLIDLLSARLDKEKIPHGLVVGNQSEDVRQAHIDDFQEGRTKFILYTPGAGGVGLTLTTARYLVRLQRPWSLIDDIQVEDRVHRIGSEIHDSIIILDYFTENTVEERVLEVLESKRISLEEVVKDQDQMLRLLQEDKVKK